MIKAIMAVDEEGGISKNGSMPWPKNTNDLKWFKKNTLHNTVVMGSLTWEDPFMPTPLKNRQNVLVTSKDKINYPGADHYISGNVSNFILNDLTNFYKNKDIYIIGGSKLIEQTFELIEEFYLTRIYGNFNCDKKINLNKIEDEMKLIKKIQVDNTCHFEIWER